VSHFTAYLAKGEGVPHVKLAGEFDLTGRELADQVLESANGASKLVIDLSGLEFIDSMGIHFIVTAHEQAKERGCDLTIVRGRQEVDRVFSLIGLNDALPFADGA